MTDTKTAAAPPADDADKARKEAHEKSLAYDPTKPAEKTPSQERAERDKKRREEEYKEDAEAVKGGQQKQSPQSQGPGGGMAAGSGYRTGPTQEEIESPVQAARDPRTDFETSNVDSGGDRLQRRGGNPATPEEKKAYGDKVPEGDAPYSGGVPGSHPPGASGPKKEESSAETPKGAAPAPQPGSGSKKP